MKKLIIGALVGSLIVFGWQTISWTIMKSHDQEYKQVPNQDAVISSLSSQLSGEGQYMIPRADVNASTKEMQEFEKKMIDEKRPWAVVTYHSAYNTNMTMNIIRGFLSILISLFLVCWVLIKQNSTFGSTFMSTLFIGLAGYLFIPYSGHIWFQTPGAMTNLVDVIVAWGVCGIWLGWWLNRK
ncbi:MAG TPA: hypothetical protein VF144_09210 [Chitinophagaceae bacterium]